MNREDIFKQVQSIFCDIFDDPSLMITDATNASDIEDWDSLAQITLLSTIEEEFNIKFQIDDVIHLQNVGEIVDLIENKLS